MQITVVFYNFILKHSAASAGKECTLVVMLGPLRIRSRFRIDMWFADKGPLCAGNRGSQSVPLQKGLVEWASSWNSRCLRNEGEAELIKCRVGAQWFTDNFGFV